MKYLIITDVHGDASTLERVLEIYKEANLDKIICLGDLLYHGPRNPIPEMYNPKKICELLKPYLNKLIWIQGNCDAEVDEMVMDKSFTKGKYLKVFNHRFYFTHGHKISKHNPSDKLNVDFVVYGHYHVFDNTRINDINYVNIGSLSLPKDNYKQYAIMDEEGIKVYNLDNNTLIGHVKYE